MTTKQQVQQAQATAWEQERKMLVDHIVNGFCRGLYSRHTMEFALTAVGKEQ